MTDQQKELEALRQHFERRGLDIGAGSEIALIWLAVNVGLAAGDEQDAHQRIDRAAEYMRQEAAKITRTLRGGASRVQ